MTDEDSLLACDHIRLHLSMNSPARTLSSSTQLQWRFLRKETETCEWNHGSEARNWGLEEMRASLRLEPDAVENGDTSSELDTDLPNDSCRRILIM